MTARRHPYTRPIALAVLVALLPGLLSFIALGAAHAQAPEPPVRVDVRVDVLRDDDTIGAPVTLRLTIDLPPGATLIVPAAPTPLGALEPAVPELEEQSPTAAGERFTVAYRTRAFVTGALPVEFPPWSWRDAAGALHDLDIAPLELDVASVLPEDAEAISPRPLKPAERLGGAPPALGVILGPIAGAFALAAVLALWRRRRRPELLVTTPPPDPTAEATATLAGIRDSGLLPDRIPEFCHRVDVAIRDFLAARYDIPAPSLTAGELPPRLAAAGAQVGAVQMVTNLIAQTDAVAYAGARPPAERVARYLDLAAAIVDVRPPAPPPPPSLPGDELPPQADAPPPAASPPPASPPTGDRWTRPSGDGAP
jgi:hypothetical protein